MKLDIKHLTISFRTGAGPVRAVRDVSLTLNEGETLAIVGESGSGKSVTARAVMGILATNAMVDNGEIIYDGRDLLKIPEEDFHTLRGHRLAMVFQDPLSALNPVMRIGRQLTEAMILNNRERRRDGRNRFNLMLKRIRRSLIAIALDEGDTPPLAKQKAREKTGAFNRFVVTGVRREQKYEVARGAIIESIDLIDEMKIELTKADKKAVKEAGYNLVKACRRVFDPFLILYDDAAYQEMIKTLQHDIRFINMQDTDTLTKRLLGIQTKLEGALIIPKPDFFCLGYCMERGIPFNTDRDNIPQMNAEAKRRLYDGFLSAFLVDINKALSRSRDLSNRKKADAVLVLKSELPVFEQPLLDKKACKASADRLRTAVSRTIDPLILDKDNRSYVFGTSLEANQKRYFRGLKQNPKEEARFNKAEERHRKQTASGAFAQAVLPKNIISTDTAKQNILNDISDLIQAYEAQADPSMTDNPADTMIEYLRARSGEYAFKLSKGLAKHRALALMEEVGIPEAHQRFRQYPFEFSGGMRQRIVIAIALSANPDILICDEPTTALDVTIQAQILDLINKLKKERGLSIIFITHDMGVVANMADRIAIMYAGKIVEYGTAEDVFYDPRHPYTWAILSSMPDMETKEKLEAIPGTPPDMIYPPAGDAFAPRNQYALQIDFEKQPPFFRISDTHYAATWLLHPDAPSVSPPAIVRERIARMQDLGRIKSSVKEGQAK